MSSPVSPADRMRDLIALALLVGGGAMFVYAYRGMQQLAANRITLAPGELAVHQWARYRLLSFAGIALAVLGVAAAVHSYWRRARRPAPQQ